MNYSVCVPGSIKLMGEYALLTGEPAIACAVDKKITARLKPTESQTINITTELANLSFELHEAPCIQPPLHFLLAAIQYFYADIKTGFDLSVLSEMDATHGLGSSAAVTCAVVALLSKWLSKSTDKIVLFECAKTIIRSQQKGFGSGIDAAASIYGGVIRFQQSNDENKKVSIRKLADQLPIGLVYSGYKTKTTEAIARYRAGMRTLEGLEARLFALIGESVDYCCDAIDKNDPHRVGRLMSLNYGMQEAMGVNSIELAQIINVLRSKSSILGAKISGAGLGDCVVYITNMPGESLSLPVELIANGICQLNIQSCSHGLTFC